MARACSSACQVQGNAADVVACPAILLVVNEEEKHPQLIRDGNDLIYNLTISIPMPFWELQPNSTVDGKV